MLFISELKQCAKCKRPFPCPYVEDWKTLCIVCFKKDQNWKLTKSDDAFVDIQKELQKHEKEIERQEKEIARLKKAIRRIKAAQKTPPPPAPSPAFSPKMYRELMILCHPDKHGGSKRATAMFQALSNHYKK